MAALGGALLVVSACTRTSLDDAGLVATTDASTNAADAAEEVSTPGDADLDVTVGTDATIISHGDAGTSPADAAAEDGEASAEASADAAPADAATTCNALTQLGSAVELVDHIVAYDPSQLAGGPLADGTYVLLEATHIVEPSHVEGQRRPYGRETLTLAAGVIEDLFEYPAGDVVRFDAELVATGSHLTMAATCVASSNPGAHLPELGDWAPLVHEETFYAATPTTLTVWTPRGNHESVLRVYTRIGPTL